MPKLYALPIIVAGLFMTSVASGQTVEIFAGEDAWDMPSVVELPAVGQVDAGATPTATLSLGEPNFVEEADGPPVDLLRGLRVGLLTVAIGAGQTGAAPVALSPLRR